MKLREKIPLTLEIKKGVIMNTPHSIFLLSKYEDGKHSVIVAPIKGTRSPAQNDSYWLLIVRILAEKTGYSEKKVDRLLEDEYAPRETMMFMGKTRTLPRHCKDLKSGEFMEFTERIRADWAQFGVILPPPDPALSTKRLLKEPPIKGSSEMQ